MILKFRWGLFSTLTSVALWHNEEFWGLLTQACVCNFIKLSKWCNNSIIISKLLDHSIMYGYGAASWMGHLLSFLYSQLNKQIVNRKGNYYISLKMLDLIGSMTYQKCDKKFSRLLDPNSASMPLTTWLKTTKQSKIIAFKWGSRT